MLTFTLCPDGSSDRALMPVIVWTIRQHFAGPIEGQFADFGRVPGHRRTDLATRIRTAVELFPCNVLFIHRDAEGDSRETRVREIERAVEGVVTRHVCTVPVRMTEAWLLFDEAAIRCAAGNPLGRDPLGLRPFGTIENEPDPKRLLHAALTAACGLNARRRSRFRPEQRVLRVGELIDDFSPLRRLPAFSAFEENLRTVLAEAGFAP